ncbi:BON domain-containing protein [Microbacterium hydrocarbonoxydans]|uniref:BON domain-containing protein n=1 Tax=Microbacterium hydrocarbonoxydans TaxID=273678 RepID=UPI0013DCEB9A|nr:BON domain-containing protein [Microbacterium hydrocarbonoxydans]
MRTAALSDLDVQTLVRDEIEWTPEVDAAGIGVAVEDGTVTLSGEVDSYTERLAAMRAAERVRGVRAVVDDMVVHPRSALFTSETDVAKEVDRALAAAVNVPRTVKAEIIGHNVTLVGQVDWEFQRAAAKRAVEHLRGVYSVTSMISLTPRASAADAEERIRAALMRSAAVDADGIGVKVIGNKVTLTGVVGSSAERRQAAKAAWSSPHVTEVDNRIVVRVA